MGDTLQNTRTTDVAGAYQFDGLAPGLYWIEVRAADLTPEVLNARVPDLHCAASRLDAIMAFDRRAQVNAIATPTLVICAEDDMVTPPYLSWELAELIPGAKLTLLPDGGHFYPQTRPEAFLEALIGFLSEG